MELQEIISKVQTKKWKNLDSAVIEEKINEFLKKNPKVDIDSLDSRSADFKKIVKFVKQELHRPYGAFQNDVAKREKLLEEYRKNPSEDVKLKILKTHSSTRERLNVYESLKQNFYFIEGKSILDLGAGLNPLMFDTNRIIAVEFNKDDVKFLNDYFKIRNKQSKAVLLDLKKKEDIEKLKKFNVDVVFAWKLFDLLSTKTTEAIIRNLEGKTVIASFSTKTLGNKDMNVPHRGWFQKMLRRLGREYEIKTYMNELFYIIT